jgi:methionyl aminopeptidase
MTNIRTSAQIDKIREASKIVAGCHEGLRSIIKPGIQTMDIERFVDKYMTSHGAKAAQKGYYGYPFASCTSVNDEICHGFPSKYELKEGDLVKVDMVAEKDGWMGDSAWCYAVGELSAKALKLMTTGKECLDIGIKKAVAGNRLGDIGYFIQHHAEKNGFSVVRDYTGHGIGQEMHEDPTVLHYGERGRGIRIQEGMVFTVEPMINSGEYDCYLDEQNGWTVYTYDGSLSVQFEHTIAITGNGPEILTAQEY